MRFALDTASGASPFFLFITVALALIRHVAYSLKENARVFTVHHAILFSGFAALGYFIYFGNYHPLITPPVAVPAALLSLHFFLQAWSQRRKDRAEVKPRPEPDANQAREDERRRSLEYMRMTAQAPGLRGGLKVETLERDLTEIKQRLIDIEEVQMMILKNQSG